MRRDHAEPVTGGIEQPGVLVASYNVHKCVGTDGRFDPERTGRVIREIDADVIALQEADKRFGDRNGLLDLARLEREAGLTAVPVSGQAKAHGWHGNVVLFRRGSVRDVHQIKLPGLEPRGAVIAEIELEAGGAIRIVAAHFGLLRHSRTRQVRAILDIMNDRGETPTLLMGDLNEWRLNGRSALTIFETAFGELPPAVPSFPSRLPLLALDRLISNRKEILSPIIAHDTPLARLASDHLPIKAWVSLAPAGDRLKAA
ncbi:endonuclease/exonuclease/phosphatase family protein [Mesorhizobium sp. 1M-11]|uniref:endonuclease/exonuclease/phosphatase family protein n=1 Tax=Mesorhizobium sp. 1M-11 TaxID=1529006 RepID=UPI000A567EEC|nr:endonuclease/exonuclease/phosphatase family protein [Mesorhizobium sp. 1M-11]